MFTWTSNHRLHRQQRFSSKSLSVGCMLTKSSTYMLGAWRIFYTTNKYVIQCKQVTNAQSPLKIVKYMKGSSQKYIYKMRTVPYMRAYTVSQLVHRNKAYETYELALRKVFTSTKYVFGYHATRSRYLAPLETVPRSISIHKVFVAYVEDHRLLFPYPLRDFIFYLEQLVWC